MDIWSPILRMATFCRHLGCQTANFTDIGARGNVEKCKKDGQMSRDA